MAPRKRKAEQADAVALPARVTRSSARLAAVESNSVGSVRESPKPEKRSRKKAEEQEMKAKSEPEESTTEKNGKKEEALEAVDGQPKKKTIVIEHCKQCNSFKTRAMQVKEGLEKGVSGIVVLLNPEKPRRGCFEIREDGGEVFISLLEMKRPFKPMKDLDMNQVIEDIIANVK